MLTLTVPPSDAIRWWDEQNEVFYTKPPFKGGILKLEHSLISVSKWESKWCKPFIDSKKTNDEVYDYIRCMALNVNESDPIFDYLSTENHEATLDQFATAADTQHEQKVAYTGVRPQHYDFFKIVYGGIKNEQDN